MNPFAFSLLMGSFGSGGGEGGSSGSMITMLMPLGLMAVIFYFLTIRPQSKRQKQLQNMLSNLKKGDKVVTVGGIHGVIQSVKEKTVIVRVDDLAKMEFSRQAIASVTADEKAEKSEKEGKKADSSDDSDTAEESKD